MAELLYQGHGSYRLVSDNGTVVYVDPFVGEGYGLEADLVLITHEHSDHNRTGLISLKQDGRILRAADMLADGRYKSCVINGNPESGTAIHILAVPAYNRNHNQKECVGYLIDMDGKRIYAAGDTSYTDYMERMGQMQIDYALLPVDGIYNMDTGEASECARIIGAAHSIPIHTSPGHLFERAVAEKFHAQGRIILEPGDTLSL